jgi:hypothetical protein
MAFYIIERQDQLEQLHLGEEAFVHVIPLNEHYHPLLQQISLFYVRELKGHKGYILCVDHSESFSLTVDEIINKLSKINKLYVLDKKSFIHQTSLNSLINYNQIYDISIYNNLNHIQEIDIPQYESTVETNFKRKYYTESPSKLIPISKHYEKWENVFDHVESLISNITDSESYNIINNVATMLFYNIEKNGLKLDKEPFIKHYSNLQYPKFSISKGKIHTQYNLNTLTCRPSNSFNGINFAALNKTNNERSVFIPENDRFIEIDFNAYHPNIIAKLVGYQVSGNFYEQLSQYFPLSTHDTLKESVFQQLYGGIRKEFQDQPFFKQVYEYSTNNWNRFIKGDKVSVNNLGKQFSQSIIENPTPQKLLNYLTQNSETLLNIIQFSLIDKLLLDYKSKIVLYTYDSILIDYANNDNILDKIKSNLIFNFSVKSGINYNELK